MVAQKNLCVLILAAGKGTRMKSSLPKPLHRVCGISMIAHSLRAAQSLMPGAICVIVGHEAKLVMQEITDNLQNWGISAPVVFAEQTELNGSAGAVKAALPLLNKFEKVMILNGDAPMIRPETLQKMYDIALTEKTGAMVLGVTVPDPKGYGRILREQDGSFDRIVEESDADDIIRKITEVNGGMYVFNAKDLISALSLLQPQGPKQEFYLTDTLSFIKEFHEKVLVFNTQDYQQALGVNSRQELALAEDLMRARIANKLMDNGVRLVRPKEVYIDEDVQVGEDTIICPGCYLKGKTVIGKNCRLDGSVFITDSIIGDNVFIKMGSYIENTQWIKSVL